MIKLTTTKGGRRRLPFFYSYTNPLTCYWKNVEVCQKVKGYLEEAGLSINTAFTGRC